MPDPLDPNQLTRFSEIAQDVGSIFGSQTDQALTRVKRCINRAAISLAGQDRRWSWLQTKDSFVTASLVNEYSLNQDVRTIHQLWLPDLNRQRIDRIPTSKFVELVPNPTAATGIPRLFDEEGVDSSGAKIVSLYPMPSSVLTINYRYTKQMLPILDDNTDILQWWGLPLNLLECLTQKAAALASQGVNGARFLELNGMAEQIIAEAYACDQAKPWTSFRAPLGDEWDMIADGPSLPPQFGR